MSHCYEGLEPGDDQVKDSDRIRRVFACVTLWHEEKDEMKQMLKSLFRMDSDQSARRLAQKYFEVVDPDYYKLQGD
jgi:chitin synthase